MLMTGAVFGARYSRTAERDALTRRYLFVCPDASGASGGVAVIYSCVDKLRSAGYDAVVLHETADYHYRGSPFRPPAYFSKHIHRARAIYGGVRTKLAYMSYVVRHSGRRDRGFLENFEPDDVLVIPEYLVAEAAEVFPGQSKIVFSQNPFAYLRSCATAKERGFDPNADVIHTLAVSEVCEGALELVSQAPCSRVAVCPDLSLFPYQGMKKRQIAYMPRKRRHEARLIESALRERGRILDFDLVCIDRMSQSKVAEAMSESLVFISLMHEEGLGFPGIEAMASGCMVIGYTGLAASEYLDNTTGIPVTEGETVGIVRAVEATVAEYSSDPSRIDRVRKHASDFVRTRYNEESFNQTLLDAWRNIEATDLRPATATAGRQSGGNRHGQGLAPDA